MKNNNNKKLAKEMLKELAEKHPTVDSIMVRYSGSGDSFDDFYDYEVFADDDSLDEEKVYNEVMHLFDDCIGEIFDETGADFNNDGSEGTITFNFKENRIHGENYYKVQTTEFSGRTEYLESLDEDDD